MTSLSLPDALRACIEAQAADHQFAAFGSALFIRKHGPALEALLRERDELENALHDLHALVWGECPSLLNEDSGGSAHLDLRIHKLIGPKP